MRLYEAVAVTVAAALLLPLIVRRVKTLDAMKFSGNRDNKLNSLFGRRWRRLYFSPPSLSWGSHCLASEI